ncbi:MAG: TolC family outer membrane protein [Paracoccaceae bacterium]
MFAKSNVWSKLLRTGASVLAVSLAGTVAKAETLADALVGAYNHVGILEQNRALLRAADENVAQAAAALLPVLNWQADLERSFGRSTSVNSGVPFTTQLESTDIAINLVASYQLYDFGADRARVNSQKETVLATREGLLAIEQQVLLRAVSAFMNVRATAEVVAIRQNNIRLLTEELRAANDRFEVGEVTRTDVALAESALAAARSELAASQGDLTIAREEYRNAIGRYPNALATPPRLPRVERNIDKAKAFAVRNHPEMLQAQHQVSANELLITAAKADIKPQVSLLGSIGLNDDLGDSGDTTSGTIGLRAEGPIYQGGLLSSQVRSAQAQRDAARGNLHVVRHDIFAGVGNAYANLQTSFAQVQATERQIQAAQVAFDGIREEAKLGARTTLDVLDAEQQLLDARAGQVQALASQYVAAYSVLASMGLLTAQDLNLPVQIYDPSEYYNLVKDGTTAKSKQGRQLDRVIRALNK